MSIKIHPSLRLEIPEFLEDSIIYCDNLIFKRNVKSCFILAKNLKFYEFRKKQFYYCLDLSETIISKIRQKILLYEGRRCKLYHDAEENETQRQTISDSRNSINCITIGKYIYRHFDVQKLYLLLRCWNTLIVIERHPKDGMQLVAEYENVLNFKIITNVFVKYQAIVKIQFENESDLCTDFQKELSKDSENERFTSSEFKHLLDRVRTTKAELQLHKEITQKQFRYLRNSQHFGCDLVRSTKLEEKSMLTRFGDVWIRITANDELVIGVPLTNNCSTPNLTVLKELQPVLNICDNSNGINSEQKHLQLKHRLYQLCDIFENLDTLENVFQNQDFYFQENVWITANEMPPNSFMVLLIKLKITELILIQQKCQLLVRFIVEKELEGLKSKAHKFEQHIFIKTFDFQLIFHQRSKYSIDLKEQSLHQDFLAIVMTSISIKLCIEFISANDLEQFEHLLTNKFKFEKLCRSFCTEPHTICNTTVEMNESFDNLDFPGTFFYNEKPNSLWFGSLVLRRDVTKNTVLINEEPLTTNWIFYNKNEDKSNLMLKFLFDDLMTINCNIKSVKQAEHSNDSKIVIFENAIREELNALTYICQNGNDSKELKEHFRKLAEYQFRSDRLAAEIE